jgi:hypothetical protein
MKKVSSLFVVVAGAFLLGACGMPEDGEEVVEAQQSSLDSTVPCVQYTAGGSTTSCKSSAEWKEYAAKVCASKGLQLYAISFENACGPSTTSDSFATAKFSCCP